MRAATSGSRVFLSATWRYLAMLNYRAPAEVLAPFVPRGTELDTWDGHAFVSVVGLLFSDTRVFGVGVPRHRNFQEVNLRVYVRREVAGEWRRAVSFIKEVVPRRAVSTLARLVYNEPYQTMPMAHRIVIKGVGRETPDVVEYSWRQRAGWSRLAVEPEGDAASSAAGSHEEFIAEHRWGYTRQRDGGTVEYEVRHPRWRVWRVKRAEAAADVAELYGGPIAQVLTGPPASAILAEGSAVTVHAPVRLGR